MNTNNEFRNQQSRTGKKELNIGDLVHALIKKWWVILIFALVMGFAGYLYTRITYVPLFTANASMVIDSEPSFNSNMVNTYMPILTSDSVLEKVAAATNRSIPPEEMRTFIDITSPKESGVIKVNVSNLDPQVAMDIANGMISVAPGVIASTVTFGTFSSLDRAKLPVIPNPPDYFKNIVAGVLLGLLLGVAIVIGLAILFPKVRSEKEIKENLCLNVLGKIPRNRDYVGKMRTKLITDPGVGMLYIEAFKRLGIHLKNIESGNDFKKFLLTSALEDDGKTTVSINLALTMANAGKSVLLIEGDIHKSEITRELGEKLTRKHNLLDLKKVGIIQKDYIRKYPGLDLYVLPLRSRINGEPLNENETGEMIHLLENEFDFIVIDAPPAFILNDSAILSKFVDGVILVAKEDQSDLDVLIKVTNDLEAAGANIIGCILSDAREFKANSKNLRKSGYLKEQRFKVKKEVREIKEIKPVKQVKEVKEVKEV